MDQRTAVVDRQRGALLGLAVGDALGAAVEFRAPGTFAPVTGYRDGGPHPIPAGAWTDDTSMALALADSIAEVGWNINDQAERYLRWRDAGAYSVTGTCFDIGTTTSRALSRFERTRDARSSGDPSEHASGNGSIMRLAPVPIRYYRLLSNGLEELVQKALESSLPTHASPQCLSACVYMTLILSGLIEGRSCEEVLDPLWPPLHLAHAIAPFHPEVAEVTQGSFRLKQPPRILGSGYVVQSLEAALWAFHNAEDFRNAVLRAVNLGDDADTTGAVCGQLAGACWGESAIPADWRDGLVHREMVERYLDKLLDSEE
ncbi:MAG: ADP-ribosylglycohydrolase family protein [Planctomycetota bacterium]